MPRPATDGHRWLAIGFTVAACLAISFGIEWKDATGFYETLKEWRHHAVTALIIVAVLELFFHLQSLRQLRREWTEVITSLFSAAPDGLIGLFRSGAQRLDLLRVALAGATDRERGDQIYKHLLQPYLEDNHRFRSGFEYRVEVCSLRRSPSVAKVWDEVAAAAGAEGVDQFDLSRQSLKYGSPQGITNAEGKIELRFVFDRDDLEAAFRDPHVFFREILQVDRKIRDLLLDTEARDLTELTKVLFDFVPRDLQHRELRWEARWSDGDRLAASKYLRILVDAPSGRNVDANFCAIEFHIPQSKSKPFCLMQIGEPTKEPVLHFHHLDPDIELDVFPFFPDSVKATDLTLAGPVNQIEFTANDTWVFPRSGVLFAWRHSRGQADIP